MLDRDFLKFGKKQKKYFLQRLTLVSLHPQSWVA